MLKFKYKGVRVVGSGRGGGEMHGWEQNKVVFTILSRLLF